MKSLSIFATNCFVYPMQTSSRENNIQFIEDTIGRFEAPGTSPVYNGNVDLLRVNFSSYKTAVMAANTGMRQEATASLNTATEAVLETGRRLYSAIQFHFGLKAQQLLTFFPGGLTELNNAKRGDYGTTIGRWLKLVKMPAYLPKLGDVWVEEFTTLQTTWNEAVGGQSGAKKEVGDGSSDAENFILPMAQNLWDLLLLVIQNNQPNAEQVVNNFFDTTPLNPNNNHDNDGLGRTFGAAKDSASTGLPNVMVAAKDADDQIAWQGKTDGEGKWRSKNIGVGMYHFIFEKPGMVSQTLSHEVLDDQDTALDVVLLPA